MHPIIWAIWGDICLCTVEKSQTNATNVTMHLIRQEIWGHIWKCKKKITFKSFFYKHDEIRFWGNSKSVQILQKISKCVGFWLSILLPSLTIFYRCTKTDQMKVRVIRLKDYQSPNSTRTDNDSNISNQNLLLQLTSIKKGWKFSDFWNFTPPQPWEVWDITRNLLMWPWPVMMVKKVEENSTCMGSNTKWRKDKQMQPVWLCLLWSKLFEDTFENAQWRKVKQMQPMWLCICLCKCFEDTFEKTQWRKV